MSEDISEKNTGSLRQTAKFLGVSYTTARNLQAKGLPIIRTGRRGVAAIIDLDEAKRWYLNDFLLEAAWQDKRNQLIAKKYELEAMAQRRKHLYKIFSAREQGNP